MREWVTRGDGWVNDVKVVFATRPTSNDSSVNVL